MQTQNSYNFAVAAVTATLSSGITLTLPGGATVALGNQTIGTLIPIRCTMATFAAGTCVALA